MNKVSFFSGLAAAIVAGAFHGHEAGLSLYAGLMAIGFWLDGLSETIKNKP